LKPSNILLQPNSVRGDAQSVQINGKWLTPKLADFGLAKIHGTDFTETATGMVAGTPEYMSPEQVVGRSRDIGTFSDTFSLGVVLYRSVTGQLPFKSESRFGALVKIETGDFVIPRRARGDLSVDMESIIVKSLRPAPKDRYRDGAAMAADLDRLRKGQPVEARPYTWRNRAARNVKLHPVALVSAAFSLIGLLMVTAMMWRTSIQRGRAIESMATLNRELSDAIVNAELSESEAVHQRERFERLLYAADMRLCQESFRKGDIDGYQQILDRHTPSHDGQDSRGFSWHWLWAQGHATPHIIDQFEGAAYFVDFSPDFRWLAACGQDSTLRIYATSDWSPVAKITTDQGEVNGIGFSSNGNLIATTGDDGTVKIWKWDTSELVTAFRAHQGIAYNVRFIENDSKLITCGNEPTIRIWDATSGSPVGELLGHNKSVDAIKLMAGGKQLVSAGADSLRIVWDLETLESIQIKQRLGGQRITDIAPIAGASEPLFVSGTLAGNSGERAQLLLEGTTSPYSKNLLASSAGVQTVCTSGDGRLVAVGDRNGGLTLVNLEPVLRPDAVADASVDLISRFRAHSDRVYSATFSQRAERLVTCGKDGQVLCWHVGPAHRKRIWNINELPEASPDETWTANCYAEKAKQMFAVSDHGAIDRWDPLTGRSQRIGQLDRNTPVDLAVVDDLATRLLIADMNGRLTCFDIESNLACQRWMVEQQVENPPVSGEMFCSEDHSIVAWTFSRERLPLLLLDVTTGKRLGLHAPAQWYPTDSFGVALSPECRGTQSGRVAYSFGANVIIVDWVAKNSSESNKGDDLQSGDSDTVIFFNEQKLSSDSDSVLKLRFVNHHTLMATTSRNRLVQWDLNDGGHLSTFSGPPQAIRLLRLLPDGKEVWTSSARSSIMTWNLDAKQNLIEIPLSGISQSGAVTSIGREITGSIDEKRLFWQPLLSSWPESLERPWPD